MGYGKRKCEFAGCGRPHESGGLCHTHALHKKRGEPLREIRPRRKKGAPPLLGIVSCCHCDKPSEKVRNQGYFCILHYRIKQMRDDAAIDRKAVPSREELEGLFSSILDAGMKCQVCSREMNMLKADGISTQVTLQHDRDGSFRLICLGCNVKHQNYPGDSFYELPADHQRCHDCGEVKPHSEFYAHNTNSTGYRSECKPCSKRHAMAWIKQKRQKLKQEAQQ